MHKTFILAFNDDNDQCLCIISRKLDIDSDDSFGLKTLSNNKCDLFCVNTLHESKFQQKIQCGSLTDSRIWAIYELSSVCPLDSIYVKEIKKCLSKYQGFLNYCSFPSGDYVYDGNITWSSLMKVIEQLNLTNTTVLIKIRNYVTIDPSWVCPTNTTNNTINSYLTEENMSREKLTSIYVLEKGCLREYPDLYSSFALSNLLCTTFLNNENSLSHYSSLSTITPSVYYPMIAGCLPPWFDINNHCYRISAENKSIQEARQNCISLKENGRKELAKQFEEIKHDADDMSGELQKKYNKYMTDVFHGEIARYTSQWQARLGFYLLDISKVFK